MVCQDCIKGVTHEGTPEGKWERIGGVDCYVGTPRGDYAKDTIVLYLSDFFGPQFINAQLMVDDFARNGFKTISPDYYNGDPAPADALLPGSAFDIPGWVKNHTQAHTRPTLDKVINALKADGVTKFAATGYCFGARYVFDLASDHVISVSVVAHPSLLEVPSDLEKYFSIAKAPLLMNTCTLDQQFSQEAAAKADEILGGGKFAPGYKREYWDGCTHGFAVRGDMTYPKVKAGKEGAFKATVKWFKSNL